MTPLRRGPRGGHKDKKKAVAIKVTAFMNFVLIEVVMI